MDASFEVYPEFNSNIRVTMTMVQGGIQPIYRKHKLRMRVSTEAEVVAVGDTSVCILLTVLFIECQGYNIYKNVMYQDNKISIILEVNGKMSAGKRLQATSIH